MGRIQNDLGAHLRRPIEPRNVQQMHPGPSLLTRDVWIEMMAVPQKPSLYKTFNNEYEHSGPMHELNGKHIFG